MTVAKWTALRKERKRPSARNSAAASAAHQDESRERTLAAAGLLAWYDQNRRVLPWRVLPGERPDPYRVWLSEIMLQQTTVAAVMPYFARFLARFPSVTALAEAETEEVLRLWAGLGYYARARNLHACAKAVAARGGFPDREAELCELPGIGAYTAAAVAAIAFNQDTCPVDGNVERVVTRLCAVEAQIPAARPAIREAGGRVGAGRPGRRFRPSHDGSRRHRLHPENAGLHAMPLSGSCAAHARGDAETFPRGEENAGACAAAPLSSRRRGGSVSGARRGRRRGCSAA